MDSHRLRRGILFLPRGEGRTFGREQEGSEESREFALEGES